MSECECKTSSTTQVSTSMASTQASTTKVENGLRCQVCQLELHMCDGESDNGKSVTCLDGEVCVKLEEGMNYKQKQSTLFNSKTTYSTMGNWEPWRSTKYD